MTALALSPGRKTLRRFLRQKAALAGLALLSLLALSALAAPGIERLWGIDPETTDLTLRLAAPSLAHPLGTDELGRDMLARLLEGGRVSLAVALAAALASAGIGVALGMAAAVWGGRLDAFLMRMADGVIALPLLPLLVVLAAVDPEKLGLSNDFAHSDAGNLIRIVLLVTLVGWPGAARLARGTALAVLERDFVLAAKAQGAGPLWVLRVHILPNALAPVIVAATLAVGETILVESALSFLGLGVQPPVASWGNMLKGALEMIWSAPLAAAWPGIAIFLTVCACNLLGDGLARALDPKGLAEA